MRAYFGERKGLNNLAILRNIAISETLVDFKKVKVSVKKQSKREGSECLANGEVLRLFPLYCTGLSHRPQALKLQGDTRLISPVVGKKQAGEACTGLCGYLGIGFGCPNFRRILIRLGC
jgi:hypothetical protein